MKRSIRLLASWLVLLSPAVMADDVCPLGDGLPWNLPAATDRIKEPETYVVLGESQNVPVAVCNCTAEAGGADPKTVWVVTWKRVPSTADKERLLQLLSKPPVVTQSVDDPPVPGKGPSNTMVVSELAAGSCLVAFGYSVQIIHADRSGGRRGRFKIVMPAKE